MSQPPDRQPEPQQPDQQPVAPPPPPPPYQQGLPPGPGYPPQPGMPAPPVYGPPGSAQGWPPTSEERTWAMLAHGSYFVLSIIGPVIILLTKGKESPFVRQAAVEALNFHISVFLYAIVSAVLFLVLIGILTLAATLVFGLVVAILAIVAASRGETYRYPLTIRMVS